ncbi:signal peptide peptidase SppA [Adhaeretor mobilis]|uniref:Signal peptide peptidase SppA n=1 Tax=Adhaeretor mobilis TaxID=1930276 RepID=A0A517N2I1_9BACT|nr:signal peptide peptidase SppA [Adhaeretor mobilis]QDT01349.1 Putative signal peptide peptidase SppA [Adhaeretor mobilis]
MSPSDNPHDPAPGAAPQPRLTPIAGQPQPAPQVILQQQPPSAFGKYGKFLLIALGLCVMGLIGQSTAYQSYFSPPNGPQEKFHSLNGKAKQKIAIIQATGTIMEGDGYIKQQIDRVRKDENVVAVVLRIDSPGGTVTGSDYLYHHLLELADDRDLPIVVSMGSICASGGYYMAMAVGEKEDTIFAEPATWTGSIGVVIPHYDLSGLLTAWDIEDDSVASHKFKLMGSPTRDLSDEERAEERQLLQTLVDLSFERFKEIVVSGRPEFAGKPELVDKIATGQIFTAQQAVDNGLVDKIGFIDAAIERAAELAGVSTDNVRAIKYNEPAAALTALLGAEGQRLRNQSSGGLDLASLLDLTAPRAYYLCTWLPSILSAGR